MNDEQWKDFLSWADHGELRIRYVDYIGEPPTETWRIDRLEQLQPDQVASRALATLSSLDVVDGFVLRTKRSYASWGADAASWELVLDVGRVYLEAKGVELTERAFRGLISRLKDEVKGDAADESWRPERDEVAAFARRSVVLDYGLSYDELSVLGESEDHRDRSWTVRLKGPKGETYEVEVGQQRHLLWAHSIRRDLPS